MVAAVNALLQRFGITHGTSNRRTRPRLFDAEPGCTLRPMNVAFELPAAQAEKLRQAAEQLGISPSELARAALSDLLADRDEDFRAAAERVLQKNTELYRRLA